MIANVIKYAKEHSKLLADGQSKGFLFRMRVFVDMLYCYKRYNVLTDVYIKEKCYEKSPLEKKEFGLNYLEEGRKRIDWLIEVEKDRELFAKYGSIEYERSENRSKRIIAYNKRFKMGNNVFIGYNVNICKQHFLEGFLTIGNNVYFNRNILLDYSGGVIIKDNVSISNGVVIETHSHPSFSNPSINLNKALPMSLTIEEGVILGANAIILETCMKIGRYSRVGAGAVVRNNVPPYSVVAGNPAKIVGFVFNPEEFEEYERKNIEESERIPIDKYVKMYQRYYLKRLDMINKFLTN